jgi:hypothetical protein
MVRTESNLLQPEVASNMGLMIPLRDVFVDMLRTDNYPSAERITRSITRIFDCLPVDIISKIRIRGSTPIYAELKKKNKIHRRGTISFSLMSHLDNEIREIQDLNIAQAISQMNFAPNIDIYFEGLGEKEFIEKMTIFRNNLKKLSLSSKFPGKNNNDLLLNPNNWLIGLNSPLEEKREVSIRKTRIKIKKGKTKGLVDNLFLDLASVGKHERDIVPLTHMYFAADYRKYSDKTFETRRDPKKAISWDLTAGTIQKIGKEYIICYSKEDMDRLHRPITIGENFKDLPADQRFLLLLRIAQKASMGESLLNQSDEGRNALIEREGMAPAITQETIDRLKVEITPGMLKVKLDSMLPSERKEFESYVQQYMLTGLFYPHKFNEYCRELGIYHYFPQMNLSDKQSKVVGQYLEQIVPIEEYERILYESTHPYDVWHNNQSWKIGQFDVMKAPTYDPEFYEALNKFINPYALFMLAVQVAGFPIQNISNQPFKRLDKLLSLSTKKNIGISEKVYPLRNLDKDYRSLFEIDISKIDIPFALTISTLESLALIIPAFLNSDVSFNYVANVMALSKYIMLFFGFSGLSAIRLATGKYSIEKHIQESGDKG